MTTEIPRNEKSKSRLEITDFLHLRENALVESDSQIQVAVRWHGSNGNQEIFNNPNRISQVSATTLVRLRIGQFFAGDRELKLAQPLNEPLLGHVENIVVDAKNSRTMQICDVETELKIRYLETTNGRKVYQSFVDDVWVEVIRATDVSGRSVVLIVPHVIVIQTIFSVSSGAIRAIIRGEVDEKYVDQCELIVGENGEQIARVTHQRDWTQLDVCLAAQLRDSPVMLRAARSVNSFAVLAKPIANSDTAQNRRLPIRTVFPFMGQASLTIRSRRLADVDGIRCVRVDEIMDYHYGVGFDEIHHVPADSTEPGKTRKNVAADSSSDVGSTIQRLEAGPETEVIDDQPAELGPVLKDQQFGNACAWLCAMVIRKPRPAKRDKSDAVASDDFEDFLETETGVSRGSQQRLKLVAKTVATGETTYANDAEAYRLEFLNLVDIRPVTPPFELAVRAASHLDATERMSFKPLAIVDGQLDSSRLSSPVPITTKTSQVSQWRYGLQNGEFAMRRILILELNDHGQHVYTFEIERLDGEEDRFQSAVLMHQTGGQLELEVLEGLLEKIAFAEGVWRNVKTPLPRVHLNHVAGETAADLAARWCQAASQLQKATVPRKR
jgi:hypothetical protein